MPWTIPVQPMNMIVQVTLLHMTVTLRTTMLSMVAAIVILAFFGLYIKSEYYCDMSWRIFNLATKHHLIDFHFKTNDCLFNLTKQLVLFTNRLPLKPIDCFLFPTKRLLLFTNDCLPSPNHFHFLCKQFLVIGLSNRLLLYCKRLPLCLGRHHQSFA